MNFILVILSVLNILHPSQLTMTNLDIKQNTIFVSHMFYLEDVQEMFINDHVAEYTMEEIGNNESLLKIKKYIQNHFYITYKDNKIDNFEFLEAPKTESTITIKYKYHLPDPLENLTVFNTFFNEYFADQKNLMVVKTINQEKGYIFNKDNTTQVVTIK